MQQAHQPTGIPDCLRPPEHRLRIPLALVLIGQTILGHAVTLVHSANREHEQQSERGAGYKGEQVGIGEGVDVVHCESV